MEDMPSAQNFNSGGMNVSCWWHSFRQIIMRKIFVFTFLTPDARNKRQTNLKVPNWPKSSSPHHSMLGLSNSEQAVASPGLPSELQMFLCEANS